MDIDLDLSVCVVTRNRAESILTLLHSLHDYADPVAFEAIVVDNHSEDDTAESVVREYPEIILYENPAQEPFIKARNRAIELARGRYVALIAENAVIQPQCLLRLLSFLDKNPEVGIAGPKMIDPDSGVIQASGRSFPTVLSLLFTTFSRIRLFSNSFWIQKYLLQNWDHNSTREVDWVVGNFQIIRCEVLEEIGHPDEGFMGMYEDADFCRRARKAGWHVYYVHDAVIHQCLHPSDPDSRANANPLPSAIRYLLKRWLNAK